MLLSYDDNIILPSYLEAIYLMFVSLERSWMAALGHNF